MSDRGLQRRVGVVMGGWSGEHEVSLATGNAVSKALRRRGHDVVQIVIPSRAADVGPRRTQAGGSYDLVGALRQADVEVAFLALHGRMGEDGCVQGLLEIEGIPYTGAGVLASALAMDKVKAKELFLLYNIPTPAYYTVPRAADLADVEGLHQHFGFPVIVKPRGEGSSLALTKVSAPSELPRALERVFEFDDWALVERFVQGAEITVGILNGQVLGALEVRPRNGLYDYHSKYTPGATEYIVPAPLSPTRYQGVLHLAARAAEALGVGGAARVDLIVTPGDNEVVLEINTLPGMTETSLLPKIAAAAGYDFADLCEAIVHSARLHSPCRQPSDASEEGARRSGVMPTRRGAEVRELPVAKSA
jgi:D-alanine-D-alanine ligase